MLPSLGFQEIVLLAVLALIVVGPKDLPLMLRKLGMWTAKLRGMAQEFRQGFDDLARQAELDELRKEVDALRRVSPLNDLQREASDIQNEVMRPLDPDPAAMAPDPAASESAVVDEAYPESLDTAPPEAAPLPMPQTPAEAR